jgi:hypothetical protein
VVVGKWETRLLALRIFCKSAGGRVNIGFPRPMSVT